MTERLEREQRDQFLQDADNVPPSGPLAGTIVRPERRRRIRLFATAALSMLVAATVFGFAGGQIGLPRPGDASLTAASCVMEYTPTAVENLAFAFDGVVTRVGADHTDSFRSGTSPVTFSVNKWFRGGTEPTVTIDAPSPTQKGSQVAEESALAYGEGTRLLVSGQPRMGGAPLADAIAWGCGFTRPYDPRTAQEWLNAFQPK